MINTRSMILPDDKNMMRVDTNKNFKADANDPVLVKKDDDGNWQPVDALTKTEINRDELGQNYGLWKDKEVTKTSGMLWWKKTEVVRPQDGKIDNDEVTNLDLHHFGPTNFREIGTRSFHIGSEIASSITPHGKVIFLNSNYLQYNDRAIDARQHAYVEAFTKRNDNNNWLVNK